VIVKVSGVSSNAVNFNIGALITSISASTATVGSTITITGAGFGTAVGTVTFGGATATTSSWTPSSIQAQVPNAATAGSIIVSVGGQASNGAAFTPTPVITGVSPGSGVTGTTVTITGTGFGSVQGSVTFSSIQGTVKTWGINSITVRAPQNGTLGANNIVVTTNGISSSGAGFTIIPTVSVWPTASAITFGQTLASSTLSGGTAAVAGTFAFTTPSIAPATGIASQSVTFTPTDTTNFYAVDNTVSVTVNKATPTVSAWPTASTITFGQTLASSTLSGGTASVPGGFAFTTPSTAPTAGTALQSVTFTPTDTTDYNAVINTISVTVNKATPTVTVWPTASSISLGQTLASSTLSGGTASVAGTFAFVAPSTVPPIGTTLESVIFTPTDATDYNTVTSTVLVTVVLKPAIAGLSLPTGPFLMGFDISGTNFGEQRGTVTLDDTPLSVINWSNEKITVQVPVGATTGPVVVTTANGVSSTDNNPTFLVISAFTCR
jgi:membrane-bound inhibitor of C-type lysozyme